MTSLSAATYFKHHISSKTVSLLVIVLPSAVANAILQALGDSEALGAAVLMMLLVSPGEFVFEICWSACIAPIQVKGKT